jgi:hypothetical protein
MTKESTMKRRSLMLSTLALLATAGVPAAAGAADYSVALAGNAFVTQAPANATEEINDGGLANWTSPATVTSIWFRMDAAGSATLALDARLAGSSTSRIRATVAGKDYDLTLSGTATKTYPIGTIAVTTPGYVRVDLKGVNKDGGYFGDVAALRVTTDVALNYADDAANYYWSRRGPSVHMGYKVPANTEYFYNEVTVPPGQDKIGSYFMANGFVGGYLGIQVNGAHERRVLFSVWDADSGARTTLVNKGADVVDNGFGGEGTGGQSYLVYNWVAGHTYRFLTRARPDGAGNTDFSAWFLAPEKGNQWRLIATWKRPQTTTYHAGVYSFVENFIDTNGYLGRSVRFGNQWARDTAGKWTEIATARFTGDATAANGQRKDYAGGVDGGQFYLRNGGFFADYVNINQTFTRPATATPPAVDVNSLPQ